MISHGRVTFGSLIREANRKARPTACPACGAKEASGGNIEVQFECGGEMTFSDDTWEWITNRFQEHGIGCRRAFDVAIDLRVEVERLKSENQRLKDQLKYSDE